MLPASRPLLSLTAADLMSESLVVMSEAMSLKDAARRLEHAGVTGAPVVNSEGQCVGVLSATDFVHRLNREQPGRAASPAALGYYSAWQIVESGELPDEVVGNCMTRDPVIVVATAMIGELARNMIDAHIHRVIVVDGNRQPIGIVSSTDILAAVSRADLSRCRPSQEGKPKDRLPCGA